MSHLLFYILFFFIVFQLSASAQKKWDGGGGNDLWSEPLNWNGDAVPAASDEIILDNSSVSGNYAVVLPADAVTVRSILINPELNRNIELVLPVENILVPGLIISGPGYGLVINRGGIFRNSSGAASGTPLSIADSIKINNDGRFIHNTARAHADNVERLSTAGGTEKGIMEFDIPDPSTTISLSGRTYGKLVLRSEAAGGSLNYTAAGTSRVTVRDILEIQDGVNFNLNFSDTFFIERDLVLGNAVFNLGNTARTLVLAVKGHIIQAAGGLITESGSGAPQVLLHGSQLQQLNISGQITNQVAMVKDGSGDAQLLSPLFLPFLIDLRKGNIISSATSLITLLPSCAIKADSISGEGFIDGPMQKQGLDNETFLFPVGKGNLMRWVALQNAQGNFTVEYYSADPYEINNNISSGIHHISAIEYWEISGESSSTATIKLSFYDPHSGGVTNLEHLRVARLQNNTWQDAGNTGFGGTPGSNGWVSSFAAGGFSAENNFFALASTTGQENPLPISDIQFQIEKIQDKTTLNWKTDPSHSVERFELQRSGDNINYTTFQIIPAVQGKADYSYEFAGSYPSRQYYRIRAINSDGATIGLSRQIPVFSQPIQLYLIMDPHLVTNDLNLKISLTESMKIDFMIRNTNGSALKRFKKEVAKGTSVINISVSDLQPGTYFLSLLSGHNDFITLRFIKRSSP